MTDLIRTLILLSFSCLLALSNMHSGNLIEIINECSPQNALDDSIFEVLRSPGVALFSRKSHKQKCFLACYYKRMSIVSSSGTKILRDITILDFFKIDEIAIINSKVTEHYKIKEISEAYTTCSNRNLHLNSSTICDAAGQIYLCFREHGILL